MAETYPPYPKGHTIDWDKPVVWSTGNPINRVQERTDGDMAVYPGPNGKDMFGWTVRKTNNSEGYGAGCDSSDPDCHRDYVLNLESPKIVDEKPLTPQELERLARDARRGFLLWRNSHQKLRALGYTVTLNELIVTSDHTNKPDIKIWREVTTREEL